MCNCLVHKTHVKLKVLRMGKDSINLYHVFFYYFSNTLLCPKEMLGLNFPRTMRSLRGVMCIRWATVVAELGQVGTRFCRCCAGVSGRALRRWPPVLPWHLLDAHWCLFRMCSH